MSIPIVKVESLVQLIRSGATVSGLIDAGVSALQRQQKVSSNTSGISIKWSRLGVWVGSWRLGLDDVSRNLREQRYEHANANEHVNDGEQLTNGRLGYKIAIANGRQRADAEIESVNHTEFFNSGVKDGSRG